MVTQAALRGGDAGQYSSGNGDNGASVHTYIHTYTYHMASHAKNKQSASLVHGLVDRN